MSNARDQLTRMLALVPYLQRGKDVSLSQLAEEFQTSPATIVKDLRVLWMCGLPGLAGGSMIDIDFEAFENDPDGVVRIDNADYLTRPMRLDSTQAAALAVALRTLRDGSDAEVVEVIDGVLSKLEDATSEAGSAVIAAAEERNADQVARLAHLRAQLGSAISSNRQVRIAYYVPARDEMTTRRVEPQAVVDRDGHSYLDAWCHAAEAQRLFRLDRIDSVDILDDTRTRPTAARSLSPELFEASESHTLVTIHVTDRARWVADYYPVEGSTEVADGGLDITMRVADQQWLFRTLLGMAPHGTLLAPQEWAQQFHEHVAAVAALYAEGGRG
ncbi:MAG: helix-turn-helix transcriptional regulator [Marmoricola sp.]